jgi:hypothetical protein
VDNQIQGAAGDGYVITGATSQQVQVRGGSVNAVKGHGVHVEGGAGALLVDGVQFSGTGGDCIAVISVAADPARTQDVTVSHNQCLNAGGNGIQIAGVLRGKVADNAVNAAGLNGILARPFTPDDTNVADSIDVVNNSVSNLANSGYFGIALQSTQNTTVSENTLRNASGIWQWSASSHLLISRNKIFNADMGIHFDTGLDRFSVTENDVYTAQYSCVYVNGASNGIVENNRCFDPLSSGPRWAAVQFENTQSVCESADLVFVTSQTIFDNRGKGINLTQDPNWGECIYANIGQ